MESAMIPGKTYRNGAPYATPPHLPIFHRFQCLEYSQHPNSGVMHVVGWGEIQPGVWTVGSISSEDFVRENWTEGE